MIDVLVLLLVYLIGHWGKWNWAWREVELHQWGKLLRYHDIFPRYLELGVVSDGILLTDHVRGMARQLGSRGLRAFPGVYIRERARPTFFNAIGFIILTAVDFVHLAGPGV